ncbi:MAG: hypothetical protein LBG75_00520 [Candidatus Nomurabacteria bacterium]|nr:hypothetical protein [Candidatus Nomurabacteria bacterium]
MITIIFASGVGTRLWPLSTNEHPKQYRKLLSDELSMLQQTYNRAIKMSNAVYMIVRDEHMSHVKEQFADVDDDKIIITPVANGTTSCVIIALDVLRRQGVNEDEPIVFVPADHHIDNEDLFVATFTEAAKISQKTNAITLVGISPTYASTNFGYIEAGKTEGGITKVSSFKEKPDAATAEKYLKTGRYYWNGGYFVGTYSTFTNEIEEFSQPMQDRLEKLRQVANYPSKEYTDLYGSFPEEAVDISLIEKSNNIYLTTAKFGWSDVGNFKDLHDVLDRDGADNHIIGDDVFVIGSTNSYIRDDGGKPVAIIGLKDVVVVNTEDGLLIAHRDSVHRNGEVAKQLNKRSSK